MLFLCYPKCTTCQKAKAWLDLHQISYTLRDIKADRPSEEELRTWQAASGLQYKALSLKDRLPGMEPDAQFALLASDGMLVRRPILVSGQTVLVGFRESEWEKALL